MAPIAHYVPAVTVLRLGISGSLGLIIHKISSWSLIQENVMKMDKKCGRSHRSLKFLGMLA